MLSLRFSIASHKAYATSSGILARTIIGQSPKSTVWTSCAMPRKAQLDIPVGRQPGVTIRVNTFPAIGR
jgi:hypothetical protein